MDAFGYLLEHQTGLILTPDGSTTATTTTTTTTTTTATTLIGAGGTPSKNGGAKTHIKSNHTIKALRALRDSNPSLLKKLSHKSQTTPQIDNPDNDTNDTCIEYWNSIQEIVHLNEDDHSLKGLDLGGLMVRVKTMMPFFNVLREKSEANGCTLEMLNLGGTDVPLSNLLQSLGAATTCSTDDEAKEADTSSSSLPCISIQKLYLSGCGISFQRNGIQDLISIIKQCPNIETLDLRYNDLKRPKNSNQQQSDDLESFFRVHLPHSSIEILHLEGNNIDNDIAGAIGDALSNPSSVLKELYLGSNKIQSNGAKSLASGLKSNNSLIKLYIEGNFIGDDGVEEFCVLLEERKKEKRTDMEEKDNCGGISVALEKLWVENNGVGKEMMKRLGRALQSDAVIGDILA